MSDAGPVLCQWCLRRLALIGLGSPYCEPCNEALHPESRRAREYEKLDEREKGLAEAQDQRDFEHAHRWGAELQLPLGRWFSEYEEEDWPEGSWE